MTPGAKESLADDLWAFDWRFWLVVAIACAVAFGTD